MNARTRLGLVTLAAVVGLVVTASAGRWQLRRAAEKQALQAAITAQGRQPALDGAALVGAAEPLTLVHRPVLLRGSWDTAHTVYLDNRQMGGRPGFYVLTPLRLDSGRAIVVQRGWIARNFQDRTQLLPVQTPIGSVEVAGLIAPPPSKLLQPGTDTAGQIRQNLDLGDYRAETQLPLLDVTVQQSGAASDGLLRDWPVVNAGVDKHYGYAVQWFAMAALIAGLYLWFIVLRPRFFSSNKTPPHVP